MSDRHSDDVGEKICGGDYIIIQRQNYIKLHQLSSKSNEVMLGKDIIDLSPLINQHYWSTFRLEPKKGTKRSFSIKVCDKSIGFVDTLKKNGQSGCDNRNIVDDGSSQVLSTDDISSLREEGATGGDIVSTLIENSKTFKSKTEYSQEKYLKKKEKKYFEYISIRKPSLRLVSELFFNRDQQKVMGLRYDSLSQIISALNIQPGGTYILHESGTQALVGAAVLNFMDESGTLINLTLGSQPQIQAIAALGFSKTLLDRMTSVRIFGLVEHLADKPCETTKSSQELENDTSLLTESVDLPKKRKHEDPDPTDAKKQKFEEILTNISSRLKSDKADGLVIASKEYPLHLITTFVPYIKPSRPIVVYSSFREPMVELYVELKKRKDIIGLHLTETWLRLYQVLPGRTHPHVTMSPSGGYVLTGTVVQPNK